MNELEAKINELKQNYETNVLNQYALTYEESQIAEQDNEVIKVLQEHKEYLDSIDGSVKALSQKAFSYKYNTLSLNLSGLSFPMAVAASAAETEKTNVLTASKRAFDEVSGQFKRSKGDYESYIQYATSYFSSAQQYYRNSINMRGKDEEQYERAMKSYSRYKSQSQEYYNYALTKYNNLIDLINNQGLKKGSISILNNDSLGEVNNSGQTEETYVEGVKISEEIMKYLGNFIPSGLLFTGTVDENGIPIKGKFEHPWGQIYPIECSFDENGQLLEFTTALYQLDDNSGGDRIVKSFKISYENGISTEKTLEYYYENGIKSEEIYESYADDGKTITQTYERKFNENGIPTKETGEYYADDGKTKTKTYEVKYNANGKRKNETNEYYADDGKTKTKTSETICYETGIQKKIMEEHYADDGKTITETSEKIFKANGSPEKIIGGCYADDGKTITETYEVTYNADGSKNKKIGECYANDGKTKTKTYEITYEIFTPTKETCECYADDGVTVDYTYVKTYDEEGKEKSFEKFNPDGTPKID